MPGLPDLDAMSQVSVATLVVRGEGSWFLSQEAAQRLTAVMPRAELAVIPDCEHMVYVENPAGLAAMVETFVGARGF
jgi:pimeloyl-ACP methyl ester carboxylesterase